MITAPQLPSWSTQYNILNFTSTHKTQGYFQTPTQLSFSNLIMSVDIGGVVFSEWVLEDCGIEPDLGDERLQEEDGELSDNASQFTTETIDKTKGYDTSDNLADQPSDEEPTEAIAEGGSRCSPIIIHIYYISSIDSEIKLFPKN